MENKIPMYICSSGILSSTFWFKKDSFLKKTKSRSQRIAQLKEAGFIPSSPLSLMIQRSPEKLSGPEWWPSTGSPFLQHFPASFYSRHLSALSLSGHRHRTSSRCQITVTTRSPDPIVASYHRYLNISKC